MVPLVLQAMAKWYPDAKEHEHRAHLGSFGIPQDLATQAMYTLSGPLIRTQ